MATEVHEANRRYWDRSSPNWKALRERDGLWRRCVSEPDLAFAGGVLELIRTCCADLYGRDVCVVGSGDNYAAFALAGLGANVTSTDISQAQLEVARERSQQLGLDIAFVRADAADLDPIPDECFDLVCSTNGFFVWISEPARVFAAVKRVLKPGGFYVFYDVHPFQRPWSDRTNPLEMQQPYWEVGPHCDRDSGTFEFTWTLADLLNPLIDAGLALKRVVETPAADSRFWQDASYEPGTDASLMDWRKHPRAGLPVWLAVCAQKASRVAGRT